MQLLDIPKAPSPGLYLVLADNPDPNRDTVEMIGWTCSLDDAAWWAKRPGVRVVKAHDITFTETGELYR